MALMLVIAGFLGVLVGMGGYLFPTIRNVETILPDHDQAPAVSLEKQQRLQELLETRQSILNQPDSAGRDLALKDISQQMRALGND